MNFVKHFASIPPLYGGLTVYVKRLSLALCKRGYMSGAFYKTELLGIPKQYAYLYDKLPKHARSIFVLPEFPKLYKACKPFKIIHTHLSFKTIFSMWLLHKIQSKPLVITVHNEMIDRELSGLGILNKYCLQSLFKDYKVQVITVNHNAKSLLETTTYYFANKIKVIPAYITPVQIGHKSDYLSPELIEFTNQHKHFIVFYAESFAYNGNCEIYGTSDCVKAFINVRKDFPDLALVFCMPNVNDKSKLDALMNLVEDRGCRDYVFWQVTPIAEMWPLLKDAKLYLRTTSTDGDSVLLREALGLGVPSLASDSVPRPKGCNTYKFGDSEDLANNIKRMLSNIKNPKVSSNDYFEEMLEVYNALLND